MNSSRDPDIFCPHTPPHSKRQDTEARKKERGYQQLEVLEISGSSRCPQRKPGDSGVWGEGFLTPLVILGSQAE